MRCRFTASARPAGVRTSNRRSAATTGRFSQHINQSGDFWIGSLDIRYSWRQHPAEDRDSWGEEAVGTLTSPECTLRSRYLSFRLGGSAHSSQRVEVQVRHARRHQYFGIRFTQGLGDPASAIGPPR